MLKEGERERERERERVNKNSENPKRRVSLLFPFSQGDKIIFFSSLLFSLIYKDKLRFVDFDVFSNYCIIMSQMRACVIEENYGVEQIFNILLQSCN